MTNYCRLCAELKGPDEIATSLTDTENLIEQKLTACCEWKVEKANQRLPKDVCMTCLDKLDKCWLFSQSVQFAQQKLLEIFASETESESELEEEIEQPPKIIKILFDCIDCSNSFPSRIALEKHDCNTETIHNQCNLCFKEFKTIYALRVHCKKQEDRKCEICLQAFCKRSSLKTHQDQGCERALESPEPSQIEESKPTFRLDCISQAAPCLEPDVNLDASFVCEIIPKETDINENNESGEDLEEDEEVDDSNHATTSNDSIPLERRSRRVKNNTRTKTKAEAKARARAKAKVKKPKKPKRSKQKERNRLYEYDPVDESTGTIYYCYLCKRRFKKFPLLKCHMAVHALPRKYKCQYCNSRFRTERHYTSHQKNHLDYYCDICRKKFQSAFALKVHKRMHIGASVKMFGCEECDHFFADVSTYYNHMKRRHGLDTTEAKKVAKVVEPNGTAKPYVCELCGKDFLEKSSLRAHSVIHLDDRPFQCDICPKAFKNKYNLKTHKESHTGEKNVQCTECGKTYSRKSCLLKHMEEHTGVFTKVFPCDFCDRTFRSLYNMQNHRRTHTGEKPYRCDVCKHDVTTKSQLDRHLKTISHMNKLSESLAQQGQHDD